VRSLTIHGREAAILWGYRTAAAIDGWTITRTRAARDQGWQLTATIARADVFQLRQRPLHFTAPRLGGFWHWPLLEAPVIQDRALTVRLGKPDQ
jgi:hypothetical protein